MSVIDYCAFVDTRPENVVVTFGKYETFTLGYIAADGERGLRYLSHMHAFQRVQDQPELADAVAYMQDKHRAEIDALRWD